MTTAASLASSCTCFSVCNVQNTTTFLNSIPTTVDDTNSPWYSYLWIVYGSTLSLPFDLQHLEFFYTISERWTKMIANVSAVHWPMAQCEKRRALPSQSCSAAECSRWTAKRDLRRAPIYEHDINVQVLYERGVSIGTIVRRRQLHWDPRPNHSNVEIMRTSSNPGLVLANYESCTCDLDGTPAYGCWFLKAVGTGMYINLGNTLVLPFKRAGIDMLYEWYKNATGVAPPQSRSKTLRSLFDRHVAFISGHFGHDTVQVRYDELPHPVAEVVVTSHRACATAPKETYARFRKTSCVPIPVHLSRGGICKCDHKPVLLNCDV